MYLIGSTAIEDELQDNIGECLETFINAGIKVWVLTGDKVDTAKSIAFSCNLLSHEFIIFEFDSDILIRSEIIFKIFEFQRQMAIEENKKYGLVISSDILTVITGDEELTEKFYELSIRCNSVICCRISPKQKAEMVMLVKSRQLKSTTLAIGDGANDVNMITTAHIGIGIIGVEGHQASRAADYSIAHFYFFWSDIIRSLGISII